MLQRHVAVGILLASVTILATSVSWSGETRMSDPEGGAAQETGAKDATIDVETNPSASCDFVSLANLGHCMDQSLNQEGFTASQYFINEGGVYRHGGMTGIRRPPAEGETADPDGYVEVDDLCIWEYDYDIQWTEVHVARPDLAAKIGKFPAFAPRPPGAPKTLPSSPVGGYEITILINDDSYTFATQPWLAPAPMNQQLVAAISSEWVITENDDYIVILEKVATGETPHRVGLRSTDPGAWFSSIALTPDLHFMTDCDPITGGLH